MDIIHAKNKDFVPTSLTHRTSGLEFKILFEGQEGSRENYQLSFVRQRAFYSPAHKHNFDQIRCAWSGDFSISPDIVMKEGELVYHPEGVPYGPQNDGEDTRVLLILQFGGASGQGYLNKDQLLEANQFLGGEGRFEKGRFYPANGSDSIDGFQALWEHCNGCSLKYPSPRYHTIIPISPQNFNWNRIRGNNYKSFRKSLGVFSDRSVVIEQLKLEAGGYLNLEGLEDGVHFLIVLNGIGEINDEELEAASAIRLTPGQTTFISTLVGIEMLHYVLPNIGEVAESLETLRTQDEIQNLTQLLLKAGKTTGGIIVYPGSGEPEFRVEYSELLSKARAGAKAILRLPNLKSDTIFLLHFNQQLDNIEWFWAVTLAGYCPALSTPLANDFEQRRKHLIHLERTLQGPIVLTRNHLLQDFAGIDGLSIYTTKPLGLGSGIVLEKVGTSRAVINGHEEIVGNNHFAPKETSGGESESNSESGTPTGRPGNSSLRTTNETMKYAAFSKSKTDLAALVLTSGSTGSAKAVCLRHGQLLHSVQSKASYHNRSTQDTFLSWIGMDHVANLVEIHLHAVSLGVDQVQVQASDISGNPIRLLELVDKHRVSYTFAPNFFLAKVLQALPALPLEFDLSCLERLISGGESNVVATGAALTERLRSCGLPSNAITPGFGMTETCAGCIYSNQFPSYDIARNSEFAALGFPIPNVEIRVVTDSNLLAIDGEVGNLQFRGPIIFDGYLNNPIATRDAFTEDGWFNSGDRAYLNSGCMSLAGRAKETIIINGVNHYPHEIESALEEASLPGMVPSYCVVAAYRPKSWETESYVVLYAPAYDPSDAAARTQTHDSVTKISATLTSAKPFQILPLPVSALPKSSLGKMSRSRLCSAFDRGEFAAIESENNRIIAEYKTKTRKHCSTPTSILVAKQCSELFGVPFEEIGEDHSVFELGATSITLFALKKRLEDNLSIGDIPMAVFLIDPTIIAISYAIDTIKSGSTTYDPVVPLQKGGKKTPLWFIHPGSGDILVFIGIAKYFLDRPIYGLRTRGFNSGERFFSTIHEAVDIYYARIKAIQRHGPYALAGYSLGSTLAFELTKKLEASGDEVRFCGVFDSPPHIAPLIAPTDWVTVALNVGYFLELVDETRSHELVTGMRQIPQGEVVDLILQLAPTERVRLLTMDRERLAHIVEVTFAFRSAALQYLCEGIVSKMDVFFVTPLQAVSPSREDWVENFLKDWAPFCGEEIKFHECQGIHATMFNEPFAKDLQMRLKRVLQERGI